MSGFFRSLLFPRACIGCDRDGVLLCERCARTSGDSQTMLLGGIRMRAALPYAGLLREAIVELKRGRRGFAGDLAPLAASLVEPGMTLVPVPTTRRRIAERGFDQTILIAKLLVRDHGATVAELLRRSNTAAQHGRSRSQRLAARGRFSCRLNARASPMKLVLFDDVRTTGATLLDAATTLSESGYEVCDAVTLAWTPEDRR